MIPLDVDLVGLTILGLLGAAAWTAWRPTRPLALAVGVAAGVSTLAAGFAAQLVHPDIQAVATPLLLDAASLPRVMLTGLMLLSVFSVLPRRHVVAGTVPSLLALAAVHLGLAVSPHGAVSALLWAASCVLTVLVLPAGPGRRMAVPYLALAGGAGVAGLVLDGRAGDGLLVLAVALRMGVFPAHSWVVGAYTLAPTALAVAVTAPMSAVALVARTPLDLGEVASVALGAGLVAGAVLTAGLALVQRELGRAVGFFTVSVEAVVLLGVLDTDHVGHLGGLMMWGVTGLALLGVGLVAAALRSRRGCLLLDDYQGLLNHVPVFAGLFLLFGLTAVGAPGTADFASEDLVLHGSMAHHPALLIAFISAVSLQGYTVLHLFYRVFFGPTPRRALPDALPRERVVLVMIAGLLILTGLAPQLLVHEWLAGGPAPEAHGQQVAHAP